MKTYEKLLFPKLENEYLENILRQLVNKYNIIEIFFTKESSSVLSYLVIHVESSTDASQLQENKWVKKVNNLYKIDIHFVYSTKLHHHYSLGNPFVEFYCRASAVIYQNKEMGASIFMTREWKKYKNRFKEYQNNFYHDHDLHVAQIKNLISEGSSNSVFTSYARLIEYDLDYLEELYCGNRSALLNLDQRIHNLIDYNAAIQRYFVRKNQYQYYITDLFVKAKQATADDDTIYRDEMYEAVEITEQGLYGLIQERLDQLKRLIKKGLFENHEVQYQIEDKPKDIILSLAVQTILESVEVEEIYLYHQINYGEKTTYYLMLIAAGAGNEKLRLMTHSLKSKTGGKYDFVLISHNRYWIQANLYQYQNFFARIIKNQYPVYSSSPYLPEFHWEAPHDPYHADLYFYYKPAKDTALQFFAIVRNTPENFQGLDSLFALFFISFCRTYIFVKTYYLPNYLSSQALWQLCIYSDADLRKYNYLIEQFWTDFFPYLDRHMTPYHKLTRLSTEKVSQMNVIVEKLMDELQNLVIEDGLLLDCEDEQCR